MADQEKNLLALLEKFRDHALSEREKGTYFETLCVDYLKNDPLHGAEFDEVWTYQEWAKENNIAANDAGIDLVASLKNYDGFCAIQCKFYQSTHRIQKSDIDSFFTASGKSEFTQRLIIETTDGDWGKNALDALEGQSTPVRIIGLAELESSPIDWSVYFKDQTVTLKAKKNLYDHQQLALEAVRDGLKEADRGKLIMACGTGKTFTSLRIAEEMVGIGKMVLYLVPSLSLMSQTVREWTNDSNIPLRSFAVCSDVQVGKRKGDDAGDIEIHDLELPATTKADRLAEIINNPATDRMTVIFSTYHSIQVISDAQKKNGMGDFDIIICDEAHRTTGATLADDKESNFIKVHDSDFINSTNRLYMTATPKIFGDNVKTKANEASAELYSMDDEDLYGKTLFSRGFSWAVENDFLSDYKVIVLAVDEGMVSAGVQRRLMDGENQLKLDDATKIIGCYKALLKVGLKDDLSFDPAPMQRALAFCKDIRSSKLIKNEFSNVVDEYREMQKDTGVDEDLLSCEVDHVDGTYNAKERERLLRWLKSDTDGDTCRILSNARCLSEGVDVPALDAIMFLHPRKSVIDVVQSVGRVMRKAPGKKRGYVILPVGIPAGMTASEALNQNEPYKVVWQLLNALRAHDDRFDSTINRIEFGEDISSRIEVVAITNDMPVKPEKGPGGPGIGEGGGERDPQPSPIQGEMFVDEFAQAIMAKIVKKCGTRTYWEDWAKDVAKIAQTHITRIKAIVDKADTKERKAFDEFLEEIQDDLNDSIGRDEAIEMLAQHLITQPVFEALFDDYSFAKNNTVSIAMQSVLDVLQPQRLDKETESLEKFYDSVRQRVQGIETDEARQKIIKDLYDKFFKTAFPTLSKKMGIVYTPIEVVDFIIHSVNDVLKAEFGQTLGSKGVHILDPFTGTGTFITRLLQSGLIAPEELEHKYKNEIHANEILLLAYYIAAINIEATYHGLVGGDYKPFEGICLTDTFQMYESEDLIARLMPDNSQRRVRQKELDIRVIMGNPPYSAGQNSANDNAANVAYLDLDSRIRETYAAHSTATNKNALYDSYIRAVRWGSDRIGDAGVMAYVSNAGWTDGSAMAGLRKCLKDEFSSLHVFHLRGNARTSGELRRKEKGNVFGAGTRTPISITIHVKNPKSSSQGKIHFYDIGDYLSQQEKLKIIENFGSINGISKKEAWKSITPDESNDWLNLRDPAFDGYPVLGDKKGKASKTIFANFSRGAETGRDAWVYNSSLTQVNQSMKRMISFYTDEMRKYHSNGVNILPKDFVSNDSKSISWTSSLVSSLSRKKEAKFYSKYLTQSIYRPFQKQWLYFDPLFVHRVGKIPQIFPSDQKENRVISVSGIGSNFVTAFMVDTIPCLDMVSKGQCFPLKLYEPASPDDGLFECRNTGYTERDGITNEGLKHFQDVYPDETINKEDLFYYIYGLLHSPEYRERFKNNLSKQLPRIPAVKQAKDFWAFSQAGRALGDLHVNYESVEPFPITIEQGDLRLAIIDDPESYYRVTKMKHPGKMREKDKTKVIYNSNITMEGIPLEAYDYVVNGKPALDWVMERQCVKTDKASGIVNDANRYAIETMNDPTYPLKLFQRVITVSLETMEIVNTLPKLEID